MPSFKSLQLSHQYGIFCVVLGAALFSIKGIFAKLAYMTGIDATTLLALRMSFAILIYIPIAISSFSAPKMQNPQIKFIWIQIIFLGFIGYYASSWLDFKGLEFVSAGLERMIIFTYPTFVIILTSLIQKKWPSQKMLLCMSASYLGICSFYWGDHHIDPQWGLVGVSCILLSSFFFSIFLIVGGKLISQIGSVFYTASTMTCAGVFILIHYIFFTAHPYQNIPFMAYLWGLVIAIFCTVIPTLFMNRGIQILGSSQSSLLATTGPVSTLFIGYWVLEESITPLKILGILMILASGIVISQQTRK
jgi:drug/metabolite transporter (DMT)-like permease